MIKLTQNDWRLFRRLQRKHKVSTEFLRYNLENIEKFIWFETWPRIVIKRYAVRKENRVFIIYYRLRRVLFDQSNRKMLKRMRQNIKQWSKRIVAWQKNNLGIKEYVEDIVYEEKTSTEETHTARNTNEDVSKQLKQQLELLKSARRSQPLITNAHPIEIDNTNLCLKSSVSKIEKQKSDSFSKDDVRTKFQEQFNNFKVRRDNTAPLDIILPKESNDSEKLQEDWQVNMESTPENQITTQENMQPIKQLETDEKIDNSIIEPTSKPTEKVKTGLNFLDMLMCKVSGSSLSASKVKDNLTTTTSSSSVKESYQYHSEYSMDSTDEFLGFDDCERIPGMLMTPVVPHSIKNNKNSVFVSESLNEYMRLNDLESSYNIDEDKAVTKNKIFARDMEGLMTPKTKPPYFDMPAVPENLLKFRTVAERKQYLQKFSKNYRLAIINNEASIYRELQRRMRTQKVKSASQMLAQSVNSSMSFTRNGWNAASFINTEFNKYYYQILDVDNGTHKVSLRGARGNNDEFNKTAYVSRVSKQQYECPEHCVDERIWEYLKPIKTIEAKSKKLNKGSLPSVFRPCPLSHKAFQKPLDDDTAALLLAGGSMAVVRMPTVELEVFPESGKPLHEIAKRYLQYILPHHDISREWAEFSVSTLQQPQSLKEAEQAAAKSFNTRDLRKSFTFVIPYLNDRNHILVRRVVDRSEKLDQSFEQCLEERELVPKTDFSFRQNLDQTDDVLLACADVVSDMINTVAISCSENSFIKIDPDGLNMNEATNSMAKVNIKTDSNGLDRSSPSSPSNALLCGNFKKHKKQTSLVMELKRLNATIIDAALKLGNDKKRCSKEHCAMGCICLSLDDIPPIREHCGKPKCMLECSCKPSNQSRIMRLDTDGRTLTTEDVFMLRRKATARLARMEKEFTSTVVLTENETLLINETNNDKKRRCTKAPKRYEDFTDTEDEQRRNSPKKTALTTIDREKHLAIEIKEVHDPVYVKDSILDNLKHCTVNLVPLPDMDNITSWCMVHNLYKCFCKGRAVEGKAMIIEKEDINTTIEHNNEEKLELDNNVGVLKRKYTFDKMEKRKKYFSNAFGKGKNVDVKEDEEVSENNVDDDDDDDEDDGDDDDNDKEQDDNDSDDDWIKERKHKKKENKEKFTEKLVAINSDSAVLQKEYIEDRHSPIEQNRIEKQKSRRSLLEVRKRFYQLRSVSCRRHIPAPRRMFLYCNRRRRLNILKYIKENENEQTRLLLNEHVMRSVYYHKIDSEINKKTNSTTEFQQKPDIAEKINPEITNTTQGTNELPSTSKSKKKFLVVNEVVDLLEDDDETSCSSQVIKDKDESTQMTSSSTRSCSSVEKSKSPNLESTKPTNHFQIRSNGGVITVKKIVDIPDIEKNKITSASATITTPTDIADETTDTAFDGLKMPKISSCFSLNVKAAIQKQHPSAAIPNAEESLDFTSVATVDSSAFTRNQNLQVKNLPNLFSSGSSTYKDVPANVFTLDMNNENVRDVYNSVIKTMNSLVSKKMQDIDCALQRESHIIPTPNADILCIMKWSNFLDAFCEGFAYIWQVKMKDATFFVVTTRNVMPLIINAMGIVNITALKPDRMPLMGKMLLQQFRNKETEKLAVVMQGRHTHWDVKGFLRSDPAIACNKPTPETHPSLTKKINVLCSLLVKQRQKELKKKEKLSNQWNSTHMNSATQTSHTPTQATPTQPTRKVVQIMPTRRLTSTAGLHTSVRGALVTQQILNPNPNEQHSVLSTQLQEQLKPTQEKQPQINVDANEKSLMDHKIGPGKVLAKINSRKHKFEVAQSKNLLKIDAFSKMSSNIDFRSVTQNDIDEIFLPELHKLDHKWLVLDLHNDFSHIFVPDFRDLVSLDRIQKVINFARQKSKIVKLQFFQNAPFDAFVTPKSGRKIYFGPLTMEMESPTLILLQSVDGEMMLRELYQLQHNIVKGPEEKTKAFWLIHFKGQTHFEMDTSLLTNKTIAKNVLPNLSSDISSKETDVITTTNISNEENKNEESQNDDDDEDCIIVDDSAENVEVVDMSAIDTINCSINRYNTVISEPSQVNTLPNPPPIEPLKADKPYNINKSVVVGSHTQSLLKVPNTNTIIKPLNRLNTSVPVLTNVPPSTKKPLPFLTLPPNTIITGINTMPSGNDVAVSPIINLPANAVVTGIQSAPPDAFYSSTIFISSSPSTSAAATTTTTVASAINSTSTTTITNTFNNNQYIQTKELNSTTNNNPTIPLQNMSFEGGPIKRRRISLFCSNNYDKMSENIAVDAVIRKILPGNAEDIQINPLTLGEEQNTQSLTAKVVATYGSTKISKIPHKDLNIVQTPIESSTKLATKVISTLPKPPIVFDVNFMDDGDEPTASIVIKPTISTEVTNTTASVTSQTSILKTIISKTATATTNSNTNSSSLIRGQTMSTTISANPNSNTSTNSPANISTAPIYKKIKLSTLLNTPTPTTVTSSAVGAGKTKLINSLLCAKPQTNIIPKFSTPRPIAPKLPTSTVTSPSLSSDNSTGVPFPFRKSSVPVKILNSSAVATPKTTKPLTTNAPTASAAVAKNSTPTLTVKQVQDFLNRPCINVTTKSLQSSSPVACPIPPTLPIQNISTIKATINPTNISPISNVSSTTLPISTAFVSSDGIVASTSTAATSTITTSSPETITTALNSTLTISKVQSFGAPQKSQQNPDKNIKTVITPQAQIIIDDINDEQPVTTPPPHIQYGYIVSATYSNQKFVAKRVAEEFYLKVPSVGILKLQGIGAVNNYLNKHISKHFKESHNNATAVWQFVAASKAVQMQNHQKSLLQRKIKNPGDTSAALNKNSSKVNINDSSLDEPILIDD